MFDEVKLFVKTFFSMEIEYGLLPHAFMSRMDEVIDFGYSARYIVAKAKCNPFNFGCNACSETKIIRVLTVSICRSLLSYFLAFHYSREVCTVTV